MRVRFSPKVPAELQPVMRELIAFGFRTVTPSARVEVRVRPQRPKGGRGMSGTTYCYCPSDALPSSEVVVTLGIPDGDPRCRRLVYPRGWSYPGLVRAPHFTFMSWEEEFIALAAHEAHHVRQYRREGRQSEVEAERTGLRRLEAWRASGGI